MCRNTFEPFMPGTTPPASQLLDTYIEMLLRGLRREDRVSNGPVSDVGANESACKAMNETSR